MKRVAMELEYPDGEASGVKAFDEGDGGVTFVADKEELGWYDYVPVMNFVNDIFFDTPVNPENFKDMMNVLAMITSLMVRAPPRAAAMLMC